MCVDILPHDAHSSTMIVMQCCQSNIQHTATMSGCPGYMCTRCLRESIIAAHLLSCPGLWHHRSSLDCMYSQVLRCIHQFLSCVLLPLSRTITDSGNSRTGQGLWRSCLSLRLYSAQCSAWLASNGHIIYKLHPWPRQSLWTFSTMSQITQNVRWAACEAGKKNRQGLQKTFRVMAFLSFLASGSLPGSGI